MRLLFLSPPTSMRLGYALALAACLAAPAAAQIREFDPAALVADLRPGLASSSPLLIGEAGGRLVFGATADGRTGGLYATDGTTGGTTRISDVKATIQAVAFRGALYFTLGRQHAISLPR